MKSNQLFFTLANYVWSNPMQIKFKSVRREVMAFDFFFIELHINQKKIIKVCMATKTMSTSNSSHSFLKKYPASYFSLHLYIKHNH